MLHSPAGWRRIRRAIRLPAFSPLAQLAQPLTHFASLVPCVAQFMKPKPTIPKGWIWLYWLDPASEMGHM